jgi:tRNA threonylcarbamoyladenosine biosynthesis protein TsaE
LTVESSDGPEATEALGRRLAIRLQPGDVVLVAGELGSGKTTLIRAAIAALGITEPVTSPTFTIGRRYRQPVAVSHLDLYRLGEPEAEDPALFDDYLTPNAIVFIEWPEAAGALLERDGLRIAARVEMRHAGGDRREIRINYQ